MAAETVGVIGVGDMGSAIGGALGRGGLRVVTSLAGRSAHSRSLAAAAGIEDLGSLAAVASEADMLLSILPPAEAERFAAAAVDAMRAAGGAGLFVDCNAVAPATLRRIAARFDAAGIAFADAGIIGRGPRPGGMRTRLVVAGASRAAVLALPDAEIEPLDLGPELGAASAMKMMYAALNKGTNALYTAIVLAAERLGVREALVAELERSQPAAAERLSRQLPFLAADAERYVDEMFEIAATFASVGLTPDFHRAAADVYALLARSRLAAETRADQPAERSLSEALEAFTAALEAGR